MSDSCEGAIPHLDDIEDPKRELHRHEFVRDDERVYRVRYDAFTGKFSLQSEERGGLE